MSVSVIIVNYNGVEDTRRCVTSVMRYSPQSEIIVVDNYSSDNSGEILSREFPNIVLVKLTENRGYGHGCNKGAKNARGKHLFFLNNDAYLTEDSITALSQHLDRNPRAGVCGPKLVHPDGVFQLSFGDDPSIVNEWKTRTTQKRLRKGNSQYAEKLSHRFNKESSVDWVTGAALMVREELFQKVGGFDGIFFMYFEDADICRRVRSAGYEVRYVPSTSIVHRLGRSLGHRRAGILLDYRRSQLHYYRKHRSLFSTILLRVYVFFRMLPYGFISGWDDNALELTRNILVVKLCCIGDAVFLTPALRSLRARFPGARITYLACSWIRDIVDQIPYVDETLLFDAPYLSGRLFTKIVDAWQLWKQLRRKRFDVVVIGHRNIFFAFLSWIARIPVRVGFASGGRFFFLNSPVDFDPQIHEIRRYMRLMEFVGASSHGLETTIAPDRGVSKQVSNFLAQYGIEANDFVVGILAGGGQNPGTTMPIKRWNLDSYRHLCKKILATHSVKILLLGGTDDKILNDDLAKSIHDSHDRIYNVAGATSLRELPALLQRCHVVFGGDSGPTHVAAAVGTQTIFLFGPSDPRLVAPLQSNSVYLWKHVHCSPCYTPTTVMQKRYFNGNKFICWTGTHECLETLTVDEVYNTFEKVVLKTGHHGVIQSGS